MADCPKHCPIVLTIFNIVSALLLIGFGIAGLVLQTINNLTDGKFFLLFSPIFMMYLSLNCSLVGGLFVAAEFRIQFIMKHFVFMKSYFGRGVFNLFMSSSVFYFFTCGNDNTVVAWIAAILIFVTGVFYIVLGCCCSSSEELAGEEELIK